MLCDTLRDRQEKNLKETALQAPRCEDEEGRAPEAEVPN